MSRVLITGGLGYVGGYLSRHLISAGFEVRISTRRVPSELVAPPRGCEIVQADMADASSLASAASGSEIVIHLANWNAAQCAADPNGAMGVNRDGTARLLAASRDAGVSRFIYFSSIHVFGPNLVGSINEASRPHPVHPYAVSHHAAEELVLAARSKGEIDGLVARLSNGVGVPRDPGGDGWSVIVNDLCRQAATMDRIVLNSPGVQERDFVPLRDVARAVGHLLTLSGGAWGDGLIHIGAGRSMTIFDMANLIADRSQVLFGRHPQIVRPTPVPDNPQPSFLYDVGRLAATGFVWSTSMNDVIDEILKHCRELRQE